MFRKILKFLFLLATIMSVLLTIVFFSESIILGIIMLVPTIFCAIIFLALKDENVKFQSNFNTNNNQLGKVKFEVAGTFLGGRQANINKFFNRKIENKEIEKYGGLTNSDIKTKKNIDKEIYEIPQEYEIIAEYPSELIRFEKEPENEHDKNAIRVMIKGMGTVGYVPKDRNISFAEIIDTKEIKKVVANVSGGNYKLWDGEELETDREDYTILITVLTE